LAFSSNLFGSITHRGGRDARVPVRAASRRTYVVQQGGKPRPYNANVFWFWAIEIPVRVGDPVVGLCRRNRPAVGCPPYVYQHVLAFSSNLFGSITHRGGRDARVPVRAASRRLSACRQTVGGVNRCVNRSRCRRAIMIHWRRNRPAVGYPPYVAL
jgi:hypothetical protein